MFFTFVKNFIMSVLKDYKNKFLNNAVAISFCRLSVMHNVFGLGEVGFCIEKPLLPDPRYAQCLLSFDVDFVYFFHQSIHLS